MDVKEFIKQYKQQNKHTVNMANKLIAEEPQIEKMLEEYAKIKALHIADVSKPDGTVIKCSECLQQCSQEELDMFGGLCEECSGAFDN